MVRAQKAPSDKSPKGETNHSEREKKLKSREAKIRAALEASPDTHIVDEAEGFELVQLLVEEVVR